MKSKRLKKQYTVVMREEVSVAITERATSGDVFTETNRTQALVLGERVVESTFGDARV